MGRFGLHDFCSSSSAGFSDMDDDEDSVWTPRNGGDEPGISSRHTPESSTSAYEAISKETRVDDVDTKHTGKGKARGKHKCSVCGIYFLKLALLKQHLSSHSQDRPFVCSMEDCGRSYKRQDHLNRHLISHQGKTFVCTWDGCALSFTFHANLQRHLKRHEKWGANLLQGSKGGLERQLTCPDCGKTFKYPSLLQTHIEHVHESMPVAQVICMEPDCGEVFANVAQLNAHTKAAHTFRVCETCGLSMLKSKIRTHSQRHEGEPACIRCPHPGCLHSYTKKSNLETHIRAVHMDLKKYACSHAGCEKRFAYKCARDKHEKSSVHVKRMLEGDFETEDSDFRMKQRGGRKRARLQQVDDLLGRRLSRL